MKKTKTNSPLKVINTHSPTTPIKYNSPSKQKKTPRENSSSPATPIKYNSPSKQKKTPHENSPSKQQKSSHENSVSTQQKTSHKNPPSTDEQKEEEDKTFMSKPFSYKKGDIIGQGANGRVYLSFHLDLGILFALKEITFANVPSDILESKLNAIQREISVMKNLKHENIVRYYGADKVGTTLNIFLEYVPGGSLSSIVRKYGRLSEDVVRQYTKQLLLGLDYLHKNRIVHRDIKGANVLVGLDGVLKLADFGASREIQEIQTLSDGFKSLMGTPHWMAPEVIMQTGHGRSADIWSVGCTVLEMFTGKPPFSEFTTAAAVMFHIASTNEPPKLPDFISDDAKNFLQKCFIRNPRLRPTTEEMLKHPWLQGVKTPIELRRESTLRLQNVREPIEKSNSQSPEISKTEEEKNVEPKSSKFDQITRYLTQKHLRQSASFKRTQFKEALSKFNTDLGINSPAEQIEESTSSDDEGPITPYKHDEIKSHEDVPIQTSYLKKMKEEEDKKKREKEELRRKWEEEQEKWKAEQELYLENYGNKIIEEKVKKDILERHSPMARKKRANTAPPSNLPRIPNSPNRRKPRRNSLGKK